MSIIDFILNAIQNIAGSFQEVAGYPLDFFKNIGLAVAGAISGFLQNIIDVAISLVYFGLFVFEIFKSLFSPVLYIFHYLKVLITSFTTTISYQPSFNFDPNALALFNAIPLFSTLMTILGGLLCFVIVFATIKILSN